MRCHIINRKLVMVAENWINGVILKLYKHQKLILQCTCVQSFLTYFPLPSSTWTRNKFLTFIFTIFLQRLLHELEIINSIAVATGMDTNGWSSIPNIQIINGKLADANAIM